MEIKEVFCFLRIDGKSIWGPNTEAHGQLPAFFSDSDEAKKVFESSASMEDQAQSVWGRFKESEDLRKGLLYHEKAWVVFDGTPMSQRDMFKSLGLP